MPSNFLAVCKKVSVKINKLEVTSQEISVQA